MNITLIWGALALAKELAREAGNSELLFLVGGIELLVAEREEKHRMDELSALEEGLKIDKFRDQIKKKCNQYFFKEAGFKPDLSNYQSAIDASRSDVDPAVIVSLEKYLDEEKIIRLVYREVRESLCQRLVEEGAERLPTSDDMAAEIRRVMVDVYRRADKTVSSRLGVEVSAL